MPSAPLPTHTHAEDHADAAAVTTLLNKMSAGDDSAASKLLPLVYDELRRLAGAYFAAERSDHTLQPTALVHEAFLRLVNQPDSKWESKSHFYRVAALAMRRVLVNHARDRNRTKRGGEYHRIALEQIEPGEAPLNGPSEGEPLDLVALDAALAKLGERDPRKEQVVQLRYFGGFSIEETARMLDVSPAQVKRDWSMARAFLLRELDGTGTAS